MKWSILLRLGAHSWIIGQQMLGDWGLTTIVSVWAWGSPWDHYLVITCLVITWSLPGKALFWMVKSSALLTYVFRSFVKKICSFVLWIRSNVNLPSVIHQCIFVTHVSILVLTNLYISLLENCEDPDQLASARDSWSGFTLFYYTAHECIVVCRWNCATELVGKQDMYVAC